MFTGLKSVIYPSVNLEADKQFWERVSGVKPYFDQPYYVGFNINGSELGLDPNAASEGLTYPVSYWHVTDAKTAVEELVAGGVVVHSDLKDVGGGMMMATFKDASGNIFGIIDDPDA
ncbi:MAG: glyoxalase [Candidatus Saccharibacteria bacterium]|nr:glyoxalase [Candidatus Saccharibacteria bacterium]